jgi:hypothetical protein
MEHQDQHQEDILLVVVGEMEDLQESFRWSWRAGGGGTGGAGSNAGTAGTANTGGGGGGEPGNGQMV